MLLAGFGPDSRPAGRYHRGGSGLAAGPVHGYCWRDSDLTTCPQARWPQRRAAGGGLSGDGKAVRGGLSGARRRGPGGAGP